MLVSQRKILQLSLLTLLCLCMTALLVRPRPSVQRLSVHIATHTTHPVVHHCTSSRAKPEKVLCRDKFDDSALPVQVLSRELVVHRVYFDRRTRGGYCNSTVFLVETKETRITELQSKYFVGCRVGAYVSDEVLFRTAVSDKFLQKLKRATSMLVLIECYDIRAVENGVSASLFYNSPTGLVEEAESLTPLFVPNPRPAKKSLAATAVVCVGMVRTLAHPPDEHEVLYHWLRYQKAIGVDHVHMAVQDNFLRSGGLKNKVIQRAIREGYLSIDFWTSWVTSNEMSDISQSLVHQDCLYRFQGIYDYIIFTESDDFFVPVKRSKSIKHYLQKWCSHEIATCQFKWMRFFPDCGWDPKSIGRDGNFTHSITYKKTMKESVPKYAHQLKALVKAGTDLTNVIMDGYIERQVPMSEAYFARVRFGYLPDKKC